MQEIDEFRRSVLAKWLQVAKELEYKRVASLAACPCETRALAAKLHLPMIAWLMQQVQFPDKELFRELCEGFQFVGLLPMSIVGMHTDKEPPHADISVSDLDACREELNEDFQSLKRK